MLEGLNVDVGREEWKQLARSVKSLCERSHSPQVPTQRRQDGTRASAVSGASARTFNLVFRCANEREKTN